MFFGLMTASTLVRTKNRQSPVRQVSDKLAKISRIILDPFAVPGNVRPHSETNKTFNNISTSCFHKMLINDQSQQFTYSRNFCFLVHKCNCLAPSFGKEMIKWLQLKIDEDQGSYVHFIQ